MTVRFVHSHEHRGRKSTAEPMTLRESNNIVVRRAIILIQKKKREQGGIIRPETHSDQEGRRAHLPPWRRFDF